MAVADYYGIMVKIKDVLEADADLDPTNNNLLVSIVEWPGIFPNDENLIHISEQTRSVTDGQSMANNTRLRYEVSFRILVVVNTLDLAEAVQLRDSIVQVTGHVMPRLDLDEFGIIRKADIHRLRAPGVEPAPLRGVYVAGEFEAQG